MTAMAMVVALAIFSLAVVAIVALVPLAQVAKKALDSMLGFGRVLRK